MTIPAPVIALLIVTVPLLVLGIYSLIQDYREDEPPDGRVPKH